MIKKFNSLLAIFLFMLSFSQNVPAYNEVYNKTYLETSQKDMKKALEVSDSLFTVSETPLLQVKSLMLSATLYQQSGEVQKSVDYALRSAGLVDKTDNLLWKAKVFGFLASQYRILKLFDYSKLYLDKAFSISEQIVNPEAANNIKGLMKQEKAYYDLERKEYRNAIKEINRSQHYFDLTRGDTDFFRLNNEQLLGLNYYHLGDIENALKHYHLALRFAKRDPENFLVGLVYNGLAQIYIDKKDLKKAHQYLQAAKKISQESQFLALKNEVYATSQEYYALTKDIDQLVEVKKKQDSIVEKIADQSNAFIDKSLTSLEKNNRQTKERNAAKNRIIGGGSLVLVGICLYFFLSRRRHRQSLLHFKGIIQDFEEKILPETFSSAPDLPTDRQDSATVQQAGPAKAEVSVSMTQETEQKILENLQKFEHQQLFTDNKVSLSSLATFCGTNTKYLSFIINTHKKKDFNNYINTLRINYIVKKMIDLPLYRKYKIGVLSDEAGFSSQNKFSTVFKKTMNMSPSDFIKYLQEADQR